MQKKTLVIGVLAGLVLGLAAGYIFGVKYQKQFFGSKGQPETVISEIDIQRKLITVKHPTKDRDINVIVKDSSEIFKVEFPFDPKNPPSQASFAPKYTKIALQDLRPGNHALIESSENIYNKYEFDDVKSIQVLP
ncbi:MAG: hypothetical protein A2117_00565 [Candidatus Wildermuthbacteria bacterium GWA2_46_15]|uniref:Uncharacterized protein n=1 Tax=Candidatus Wildermuthbacteria bacterium GWA2_46_15 TaxID=1802443 RepID=A0A1G2QQD3_9BACT|nr:MAG: hypothetical protein A2117_00565 [Candidatus Wildermuthbacteria bacterium GWA2_46_15]